MPNFPWEIWTGPQINYGIMPIHDYGLALMAKRKRTDELDAEVLELYRRDPSAYRVGEIVGLGATTVYRILSRHGVKRRGLDEHRDRIRKLPNTEAIKEEYEAGTSMNQLARKYGVCLPTVADALNRAGAVKRRRGGARIELSPSERKRIVSLYEQFKSQELVAAEVGRSQPVISRILRNEGITDGRRPSGARHGSWKGGRRNAGEGYISVWTDIDDPLRCMADSQGYVLEHRLFMAKRIGRPLDRHETVHHINGDKTDNRIENLQLRHGQHGKGVAHRCRDCGSTNIESVKLN